jgi:hypothetical protein
VLAPVVHLIARRDHPMGAANWRHGARGGGVMLA